MESSLILTLMKTKLNYETLSGQFLAECFIACQIKITCLVIEQRQV